MMRTIGGLAILATALALAAPAAAQIPRQSAEVPGLGLGQTSPTVNPLPLPAQHMPSGVQPNAGQAGSYVSNGMGGFNGTGRNAGSGWRPDGMGNLIGTGNNAGHRCATNSGAYKCK